MYIIYNWHNQIFIKKGRRRSDDCFIVCSDEGGKQHTKCPTSNMTLRNCKIICRSVHDIPEALQILTNHMGLSKNAAKCIFDSYAAKIRQWVKEEEEIMPATPKNKETPVKLLNYIGELVFIPKAKEDMKLVQALIDCRYYLERSESTPRRKDFHVSYYTKDVEPANVPITVTYGIFELKEAVK